MSPTMIEKYDKYWTVIHGLIAVAIILDPRLKMTIVVFAWLVSQPASNTILSY